MPAQDNWLFSLFSLSILPSLITAICYYPDGTVTNQDVPCLPGSEASWCCGFGYACLSNKICMATNYTTGTDISQYVRGSCTDESWRDANCPSFCVNGNAPASDDVSGGEGMALCPNTTNTYYCIDFNQDAVDCAKLENIAYQATGTPSILTIIGYGSSTTSTPSATGSTTHAPTSNLASATSNKPAASHTPTASNAVAPASTSSSTGAIAGGTVGGVVVLLAICGAGFYLYRRSSKRKSKKNTEANPWFAASEQQQTKMDLGSQSPDYYGPGQGMAKCQTQPQEVYTPPAELDSRNQIAELAGRTPVVERGGGWNAYTTEERRR